MATTNKRRTATNFGAAVLTTAILAIPTPFAFVVAKVIGVCLVLADLAGRPNRPRLPEACKTGRLLGLGSRKRKGLVVSPLQKDLAWLLGSDINTTKVKIRYLATSGRWCTVFKEKNDTKAVKEVTRSKG